MAVELYTSLVSGEEINKGDAIYVSSVDGKAYRAQATSGKFPAAGFATHYVGSNQTLVVADDDRVVAFSGLTPGALYFLSPDTPGAITTFQPSNRRYIQEVGIALADDELNIDLNVVSFVPTDDIPIITLLPTIWATPTGGGTSVANIILLDSRWASVSFAGSQVRNATAQFKLPEDYSGEPLAVNFYFITKVTGATQYAYFTLEVWEGGEGDIVPLTPTFDITVNENPLVPDTSETIFKVSFDLSAYTFTAGYQVFINMIRDSTNPLDTYSNKTLYMVNCAIEVNPA